MAKTRPLHPARAVNSTPNKPDAGSASRQPGVRAVYGRSRKPGAGVHCDSPGRLSYRKRVIGSQSATRLCGAVVCPVQYQEPGRRAYSLGNAINCIRRLYLSQFSP